MSSHREAPEISKDPVADNTDTYAFVSPDKPDTVTIITNYIPLEDPPGGPNFFEFGDDVLLLDLRRQRRRRAAGHRVPVQVQDQAPQPGHVPLQHRPDHGHRQPELEPAPVLRREPGRVHEEATTTGSRPKPQGARAATWRARRATSGRARRRTTGGARDPAVHSLDGGDRRCSPASATRGSSSTSGRSSTSATCARCRTCT